MCVAAVVVSSTTGASTAQAGSTLWVAVNGSDTASGSSSSPLRSITRAVKLADSGDTVMVRTGVYNESVQVYRKAVHIRSAPGHWAALDGTRQLSGFRPDATGGWSVGGWTSEFARNTGPMVEPSNPVAGYPDQVFSDGRPLRQVLSRGSLVSGTFFHDTGADRLVLADDPAGRRIDASNLAWGIYFNEADGSSLTNMSVRRYATPHTALGAIRAYGDDIEVSGVISEFNAYMGISMIGRRVTIRDSRFNDNGYIGVHAHRGEQLVVDSSSILSNNAEGFSAQHSAAGFKVTESNGIRVSDNEVRGNDGPGVWIDISSSAAEIVGNVVVGNGRSGIEVELTNGAIVAGNVAWANGEAGIWVLESQNVEVWHNTVFDNEREIYVLEGPRRDVSNVRIRNNVMGRSATNRLPLLSVNDWTENRSAAQMNVTVDANTYWRQSPVATPYLSRWARWPQSLALNRTLGAHVSTTGSGTQAVETSARAGLPVEGIATGDFRGDQTAASGMALPDSVASALGVGNAVQRRSGSFVDRPLMARSAPTTRKLVYLTDSSVSVEGLRHAARIVDLSDF